MAVPTAPSHLRRRDQMPPPSDGTKARLFLALACLWPLLFVVMSIGSEPNNDTGPVSPTKVVNPGLSVRKYLDRVDVMGYGPTHPRVAVVVVGDDRAKIVSSIESVFRNTDIDRLFIVCAVLDGVESDPELLKQLTAIDQGALPHWHGLRPDMHKPGSKENTDEPHGKKIHVLFSKNKQGTAASRSDAVDFVSLLSKKHEQAGIKSQEEDLILLLIKAGSELTSRKWLSPVTSALIVPPPLLGVEDPTVALKIANAVSFGIEGVADGKAAAFDYSLRPIMVAPSAKDMALSNGNSYPTPVVAGAATAMRLATYQQLPAQDLSLTDEWQANLDLALNLWLCADGIDVIKDVVVQSSVVASQPMEPRDAARFAAAWMDLKHAKRVYEAITKTHKELTRLEWDTMLAHARGLENFPAGLQNKCRPFDWYVNEVNPQLMVEDEAPAVKREKPKVEKTKATSQRKEEKIVLPDSPLEIPKTEEEETEPLPPPPGEAKKEPNNERKKPAKPIDAKRLALIQGAPQVDITYVDVSGGHVDFPHKGARFPNGTWGYIHDETALHRNPPKFEFPDLKAACDKRDNHYKMLTEQVFVDFKADEEANKSGKKRAKIFCLVYTIDSGHDRIPFIRETWGPRCDGFMVGSNKTDVSIGAVDIPHEGPEEYNNIWQKVRSMWSYIYDNYYDKYDWFHIGGDDLYLLVENLRLYLESEEILTVQNGGVYLPNGDEKTQIPLFLGRRFQYMGDPNDIFLSGGSGYTMNKAAFKLLMVDGIPNYFPHAVTFSEDTMVARIFRKMRVYPYDTKDEEGGERYNPFQPGHHWGYRPPADISKDWYAKYSIDVKWGKEHCAKRSVAFHYIKNEMQKRLHALLYNLCPK